jgi:polygalacturonase
MPIVTCTVPQAQTVKGRAANEHRKDGVPGMKVMNVVTPSGRWTVHGTTNSQPLDVATASVSTMGVVRAASVVGQQRLRRNCNPPMRPQGNTAPDANGPLRSARTDLAGTQFHAHRDRSGSSAQANDPRRSTTPIATWRPEPVIDTWERSRAWSVDRRRLRAAGHSSQISLRCL